MVGWFNTCSVHKDGHLVGHFCAFKKEKFAEGHHWELHKGRLQPADYSDQKKVTVKVLKDPHHAESECRAEVKMLDCAELLLQMFPELAVEFAVAQTYTATVIIQRGHGSRHKGVRLEKRRHREKDDDHDYGSAEFLITSLTIHSATKEFGSKDKGKAGVEEFLKAAGTAVPTDLMDGEAFAKKLKSKTERREKPVDRTPCEYLRSCSQCADTDCTCEPTENAEKPKHSTSALEAVFEVAVNPTSCCSGNHLRGHYCLGKYSSDEEDSSPWASTKNP
nr:hypothetical protein BaRGS_022463 [Batillaria attramentaria]